MTARPSIAKDLNDEEIRHILDWRYKSTENQAAVAAAIVKRKSHGAGFIAGLLASNAALWAIPGLAPLAIFSSLFSGTGLMGFIYFGGFNTESYEFDKRIGKGESLDKGPYKSENLATLMATGFLRGLAANLVGAPPFIAFVATRAAFRAAAKTVKTIGAKSGMRRRFAGDLAHMFQRAPRAEAAPKPGKKLRLAMPAPEAAPQATTPTTVVVTPPKATATSRTPAP